MSGYGRIYIVNPIFSADEIVPVNVWVFLIAGGFAFFTNMISSKKPAKLAGDCSPIEVVRYVKAAGKGKKRKRESGGIYSMALQNMFRDKKQAVIIFLSFMIALSVFIVINVIIRENDAGVVLNEVYSYDIQFKNESTLDDDRKQLITDPMISQIENMEGVKSVRKVTSAKAVIPYPKDVYGVYYEELYQSRYSPGNYEEDMELYQQDPDNDLFNARFISADEKGFEVLNENLGNVLNKNDFEDGKIAVAVKAFTEGDSGMTGKTIRFSLPDGKEPDREYKIQIAAVGDIYTNPAYFSGGYSPDLIVSEKYAKELLGEPFTELIDVEYEEAFSKETEQKVKSVFGDDKQISYDSKLERYSEMKNSETQVKVLGNSLGFVIGLLAVLNYFNMMAASVQNRSKEFAALESIGMTTKQIRKTLRMEGLGYAVISIVISIIAGIPVALTHHEFFTLFYLAQHPSWVLSKEQIYEAVWKENPEHCGAAVANVVCSLRRKVGDGYIETVIGSGYRFVG